MKLGASLIGSFLFAGALALAGCNADTSTSASGTPPIFGGTTPVLPGGGGTPGPTGTRVQLLASSPQMPSSGAVAIDLTAVVLDANGQAVPGAAVVFSTGNDPSAFTSAISGGGVSDANGTVTAKLNLGSNKANRTIPVTATASGATVTTSVDVIGTAITISGNSSIASGASTTLTFTLKDSAGTALPGFTMTLASQTGNSISPASGTTNASGQLVSVVTATAPSNDVITATAAGTTKTQALTISSTAGFAFTTPAPSTDIPLNTPTAVSVRWTNSGLPVVGGSVTFAASRGTVTGSPSTTNGTGDTPGVSISSTSAGPATITASGPNNIPAATLNVVFVATTASSVAVQAVPSTVQVTTGSPGQSNNSSTISVVVRDSANNLVKNARVSFTILSDPSGGSLTAASAITDVTGSASVTYLAGSVSSPQNGVIIRATVTDVGGTPIAPISNTTTLTVSGQALLVRLGTDNLVQSQPPLNKKTWAAFVTDAAGNAVVGATVRFALRPGRYLKGFYALPGPAPAPQKWTQVQNAVCANEDVNFNGILDPGEDFNGNGALEPPGVTTVNATATTDSSGVAFAIITYPKDHATWTEVILEARSGVAGNDPPTTVTFFLAGLASDYSDLTVSPPGANSPFGVNNNCASTQ